MKNILSIIAAAGLASAYVTDYSDLSAREVDSYNSQLELIARALDEYDTELLAREPVGSRRGSTASSHEMQPLSRTSSWSSMHAATDSHGKKQSSGVGRSEGDSRDASRKHQAQNAAQRTASYARKNPAEATSSTLSGLGSILGAAGAANGAAGNAAAAAGCGAGAACFNGAANLLDKWRAGKKTASGKGKRALMARALMAEMAMEEGLWEIEARSVADDDDVWGDEYYY